MGPYPRYFIFEINVGKRRIRHTTNLKLNYESPEQPLPHICRVCQIDSNTFPLEKKMFQFRNIFYPLCSGNNLVKVRLLLLQISILVGLLFDRNISMTFYILRHVTLLHQCQCTLVSGRFKLMTSFDRLMTSNQELKKVMSNPEFSSGRPRSIEVTKTEFQIFPT